MKNILIIFVYIALLLSFRAEAQDLLSASDLREQVELLGVEISPDGKRILAFTRGRITIRTTS